MKTFLVITSGFGKQLYLAETAEAAIEEFRKYVAYVEELNGYECGPQETIVLQVRRIGLLMNHKK